MAWWKRKKKAKGPSPAQGSPDWLRCNPWKALCEERFTFHNALEGEDETHTTRISEPSLTLDVPSGELILTSLIMDLSPEGSCGGFVRVPPGTYEVRITSTRREGSDDEEAAAYVFLLRARAKEDSISLLWSEGGDDNAD